MAIDKAIINDLRSALISELPIEKQQVLTDFDRYIQQPNYRAAFYVVASAIKQIGWSPSEKLINLVGEFWHKVAE